MSTSASNLALRLFSALAWSLVCIALMYPVKDDLAGLAVSLIASVSASLLSSHTTSLPASLLASFAALVFVCLSACLAASVTALPAALPLVIVTLGVLNIVVRRLIRRALAVEDSCQLVTLVYDLPRRPRQDDLSLPLALVLAARLQFMSQAAAWYPTAFSLLDATKDSGATATEVDAVQLSGVCDAATSSSWLMMASNPISLLTRLFYQIGSFAKRAPVHDTSKRAPLNRKDDDVDLTLVDDVQGLAKATFRLRAKAPPFVPSSLSASPSVSANLSHSTVQQEEECGKSSLNPSAASFVPSTATPFARPSTPVLEKRRLPAQALSVQWARGGCLIRISAPPASPSSIASKVVPPLHVTPLLDAEPSPPGLSANIRDRSPPPLVAVVKKNIVDEDAARPGLRASIWAPSSPALTTPDATRPSLSTETSLPVANENKNVEDEDDSRPGIGASIWAPLSSAPTTPEATRPRPSARIPSTSTPPPATTIKKDMENDDEKRSGLRSSLSTPSPPAPTARDADEDEKRPGLSASIWASATSPLVKGKKIVGDDDENRPGLSASMWALAPAPANRYRGPKPRQPLRARRS
ncbi:hypothetical protein DFH06DRAFT_1206364 [Mycena polygramma]|nr:hypothetical protein DFH06DRAFT_1206364 [Mycena polygramma]